MTPTERIQHLLSTIGGLQRALSIALDAVTKDRSKEDARPLLESLRDRALADMKNSGIPAEFEMRHANVVKPSLDAIQMAFDEAIEKLSGPK